MVALDKQRSYLLNKLERIGIHRGRALKTLMNDDVSDNLQEVYNEYDKLRGMIDNDEIDTTDELSIGIMESFIESLSKQYENLS